MNKLFLPYNKTILKVNFIFSIFLTLLSGLVLFTIPSAHSPVFIILRSFIIWMVTGGFFLSAFYFEVTRNREYYFYYNLGLSKIKLILIAYSLQLIFILPLIYVLIYV